MTAALLDRAPALPEAIWALAARRLDGAAPLHVEGPELDLDLVLAQGLAGLLIDAADRDEIDLAPDQLERVEQHLVREAELAVRLEAELVRLGRVLARHGAVVLKGPVLAHAAYPDPRTRPFTDLDLLVASASMERVLRDLQRLGYDRPRPDPTPSYASRVAKATTVVHPNGLLVDLHRTITPGRHGRDVDVLALLRDQIAVPTANGPIPAPSWEAHLVVVGLHAVVGDNLGRALSVRDVAAVVQHPDLDPVAAAHLIDRWQAAEPLALALHAARDRLNVTLPEPLAALASQASHLDTEPRVKVAASADRRLQELRHSGGLRRDRLALLRSLLAPSPTFLRWTYGDHPLPVLYVRRWNDLRRRTALAEHGVRT